MMIKWWFDVVCDSEPTLNKASIPILPVLVVGCSAVVLWFLLLFFFIWESYIRDGQICIPTSKLVTSHGCRVFKPTL